jgi:hypothetical protein
MTGPNNIGKNEVLDGLVKWYAERVVTKNGNVYYRFPVWFQHLPNTGEFVIHTDMPEDLSEFIVKSGLGGGHPKPTKPKS